ncbi:MAG: hypothetical protein HYV07_07295 [Deltaproteobacteria bacterium]|nr:hypothetical protein [Deltaproteobacteria bacterium]
MTDPDELNRTLIAIATVLEKLGATWCIGGSVASSAHGEPRATNDVDLIAALSERSARAFVTELGPDFYADADSAADAVRRRASFNVIDNRSFIKVDIFVPKAGRLGLGQLDRRRWLEVVPGRSLPVLGPEDVILQKLRWYQLAGEVSDRQWRDVVSVVRLASPLDDSYLDEVARAEGLTDLLLRARLEARRT